MCLCHRVVMVLEHGELVPQHAGAGDVSHIQTYIPWLSGWVLGNSKCKHRHDREMEHGGPMNRSARATGWWCWAMLIPELAYQCCPGGMAVHAQASTWWHRTWQVCQPCQDMTGVQTVMLHCWDMTGVQTGVWQRPRSGLGCGRWEHVSSVAARGHGRQAKQAPGGRAKIQQACEQRRTKRYAGAATCQYWDVTDTDRPVLGHSKAYIHTATWWGRTR